MNLIQVGEAAKILGVSDQRVRQLEKSGEIDAMRTPRGVRFFLIEDVERLRQERQQREKSVS